MTRGVVRRRAPVRKPAPKPAPKPAAKPAPTPAPKPSTSVAPRPSTPSDTPTTPPGPAWSLPVPTARERLYLNRFGTGFSQASLAALRAAGTPDAWLAAQLRPDTVPESAKAAQVDSWFDPLLTTTSRQKMSNDVARSRTSFDYGNDLGNWSLLRRIYSARPVLETMTDFWSAALHVPISHEKAWAPRFDYDKTIRRYALGRFEDLLIACALHPAMLLYLDNWRSVKDSPNENQGRELLELHTVGRTAGYTEDMVKDSAKILSGYTVDMGGTLETVYDTKRHSTGPVRVLGFSSPNSAQDGRAVTLAYLSYLARHPATARRIATKLATYFVSDTPSDSLVGALVETYQSSGTDIAAVLTTLSTHPEFLTSERSKVRTAVGDMVATTRVLLVDARAPISTSSFANSVNFVHNADRMFTWPRPDGPPIDNESAATPSRVFGSYQMHRALAGGNYPTEAVVYRTPSSWLPTPSLRFDAYVDHLCRQWLGRQADARLVDAACQAVSGRSSKDVVTPATVITSNHPVASSTFLRLATALLDSPDHMTT